MAVAVHWNGFGLVFQLVFQRIERMRTCAEERVPRRTACRVMIPNQVSIWFIQLDPLGVKWKCTCGLVANQSCTLGVVWVDRLSSTTWI